MSLFRQKTLYREEAVPLITYNNQSQKYIINDDALEFINSLPSPLAIISVAGLYRTGKSYLLNRMILNRSNGFGVGPTVNPCTKGLWIWGKPLIGQTAEGDTINVLVIDSEGIGALDEDSAHDSRIFALAILLSSCFIYNSVGSIDENAIQNLSLVVNLTKNIHIRSQNNEIGDVDCDDYSSFFPSFIWVVRDFTLQLVDNEGEPINSKEYLERALTIQKGFSDSVESKNRIRRLLQTFFKERDCFTMVRPLMDEENLQNLDKMDFDKLRPEFFEQVIMMRKRVLNRIKPKMMNNRNLNGEMYVNLLKSYVGAINNGAVPNIENAWTYICKNECMKAMYDAMETYDKMIKEILHNKLPMTFEELKVCHKMAKESAMNSFKKKAIGDVSEEFLKEFTKKVKQKLAVLKTENEKESVRVCSSFINQEFYTIEKKLKNNEYKSYTEYERDIRLFYTYFMENGPKTVNKQVILLEFLQKNLNDGANFFIRSLNQEAEFQKTISGELTRKLEQEIKETKDDSLKEKNNLLGKVAQLQSEKTDLELREQGLKEGLAELKTEKEKMERNFRSELQNEKSEVQRVLQEYKTKISSYEENMKESDRQNLFTQSENEKEKALLLQKIAYLEKNLEEINKKEKEQANEMKNTKKDHIGQIKEISSKYEILTKTQQQKINELQEKLLELENDIATKEQKYEMERKKWNLCENNFNNQLAESNQNIQSLQREIRDLKNQEEKNADLFRLETDKNIESLKKQLEKQIIMVKEKEEALKNLRSEGQKERAVLLQKNEFLELQLCEIKKQLNENKSNHEKILQAFEKSQEQEALAQKMDNKQINELKENHKKEIKSLEAEFEATKKRLGSQLEMLTERNNELDLKVQFQQNDYAKEIQTLKEQLEQSDAHRTKLLEQNKTLDSQKLRLLKEAEERYILRIKQLETDLEESNLKSVKEIKEIQAKSEESLSQLKNFYEVERERLEKRLVEEKNRYEKKSLQTNEEYENRLKEEQGTYEEEIEGLKEDLREQELQNSTLIQQYEHEIALKQQTIDNLEKHLKETKENLTILQSSHNTNMEQQLETFSNERKALLEKVEGLNNEVYKKEKEMLALGQKNQYLEGMIQKKDQSIDAMKADFADDKSSLNEKLEETRNKLQKLNDEYLEKKIEFGRELALSQQQNEFQTKKISDLQSQNLLLTERYEEKLKNQKNEILEEFNAKIAQSTEDKGLIEQKYEKIKRSLKDMEADYNKQLSQIEKERAIVQEKLANSEAKRNELEAKLSSEKELYQNQVTQLKEFHVAEKMKLQSDYEKYRDLATQLEAEKMEISTNYEKDKVLWEGKFNFLEQQREQMKQDSMEQVRKFETTLTHLKRAKLSEKEAEQANSLNETVSALENKYQNEISEINQNHAKTIENYEMRIRKLEKELKTATDKSLIENHGKIGNQLLNEKKLAEYMDNEKRLSQEIENIKQERDLKIVEYQKLLDVEREKLKQKIQEVETKYKDSEAKRSSLLFEHEKERAKWSLEKDHLCNQRNDLQETIEKLEKKKEMMLRENEKLKNEAKMSKKASNQGPSNLMHAAMTSHLNNNFFLGSGKNLASQARFMNTAGNFDQNLNSVVNNGNNSSSGAKSQKSSTMLGEKNLADITNFSNLLNAGNVVDMNKTMLSNTSNGEMDDIIERGVKFN